MPPPGAPQMRPPGMMPPMPTATATTFLPQDPAVLRAELVREEAKANELRRPYTMGGSNVSPELERAELLTQLRSEEAKLEHMRYYGRLPPPTYEEAARTGHDIHPVPGFFDERLGDKERMTVHQLKGLLNDMGQQNEALRHELATRPQGATTVFVNQAPPVGFPCPGPFPYGPQGVPPQQGTPMATVVMQNQPQPQPQRVTVFHQEGQPQQAGQMGQQVLPSQQIGGPNDWTGNFMPTSASPMSASPAVKPPVPVGPSAMTDQELNDLYAEMQRRGLADSKKQPNLTLAQGSAGAPTSSSSSPMQPRLQWVTYPGEAFEQKQVFQAREMTEQEADTTVESNMHECIGYSYHSSYPEHKLIVKKGSRKFPNQAGWTTKVFKTPLPTSRDIQLYSDDWSGNNTALGASLIQTVNGWGRPARNEGVGDLLQCPNMIHSIDPNDLEQGGLGDCWLISTFAALAEFPNSIESIVYPKAISPEGRYTVSLYDYQTRSIMPVAVDDRIPKGRYDKPAFTDFSKDEELWPCILEKAVAKQAGCYENIQGGDPLFAMGMLTGTGCKDLIELVEQEPDKWICTQPDYKTSNPHDDVNSRMLIGKWSDGTDGSQPRQWKEVFRMLVDFDKRRYLMCCGSHAGSDTKTNSLGVVQGHAYTLLQVVDNVAGTGLDLLQLRNPWGTGEWTGAWSDRSDQWQKYPQVQQAVRYQPADDGLFWIEASDFFRNYSSVMICCKDMGSSRVKQTSSQGQSTPGGYPNQQPPAYPPPQQQPPPPQQQPPYPQQQPYAPQQSTLPPAYPPQQQSGCPPQQGYQQQQPYPQNYPPPTPYTPSNQSSPGYHR